MSKREYTHVRLLYPEIKAMIEAGKTQREIAEHYGFKDKYVVKGLLKRERRRNAGCRMHRAAGEEQITQRAQLQPQNQTPGRSEIL